MANGTAVAAGGAGVLLLYSAVSGKGLLATMRSVIQGKKPASIPGVVTPPASGGGGSAPSAPGSVSGNVALGKLLASPYGWGSGSNWNSLYALWQRESGWNNNATNPTSGAYGIAQALGHGTTGTQGSVTNEYGGYGVSDGVSQAANSGSASAQISWGLAYIRQVYGTPDAAWANESSAGSY